MLYLVSSLLLIALTSVTEPAAGRPTHALNVSFCCAPANDLYRALIRTGVNCPRFATPTEAVEHAPPGSGLLILADRYPQQRTQVGSATLATAARKRLKMFLEYPAAIPGVELGSPREEPWERLVVVSDALGTCLPRRRILVMPGCRILQVADRPSLLVSARVAGFDSAALGLPKRTRAVLFEVPGRNLLVATTRISGFIRNRAAPQADWAEVWRFILRWLDPGRQSPALRWAPLVRPAYGPQPGLPHDVERRAFQAATRWYADSRLLLSAEDSKQVHQALASGAETRQTPGADRQFGDGRYGILEGYASPIEFDGSQRQRIPLRADCNAESAMALALDWSLSRNPRSRSVAVNLLDFVCLRSGLCKGPRGDPAHPAFGLVGWGDVAPLWEIASYGDDNARVMLATMAAAACLGSSRWNAPLLRALLANLRTTGTLGFRGDRIDLPDLERNGWRHYHDARTVNLAPHFEAYLWACYLWAYRQTGIREFLDRTKTAIRMTMEGYPDGWRWRNSIERARMLLPLAWLVRVEDTPEHRAWLDHITRDLLATQEPCGALREEYGAGHQNGFDLPATNEEYGTSEGPLIQKNGDPASDQLYTTPFALLGLHEASAATNEPRLKDAETKLARYLCRIQIRSKELPYLDGAWFRAFDYRRWEYWASSSDAGWGAWSIESGWGQAWTTAVLALRLCRTSLWDLTVSSTLRSQVPAVAAEMSRNSGDPWHR